MKLYYKDTMNERVFGAHDKEGEVILNFLKQVSPEVLLELVRICEARKYSKKVYIELTKLEHQSQEFSL